MKNKQLWNLTQNFMAYSKKYNIKIIKILEHYTGIYCIIAQNENQIIVYFKGTDLKWNDILTDINIFKTTFQRRIYSSAKVKVHKGFENQYMSIRDKLFNFLNYNVYNFDSILIIGHSLGAALSTLCLFDLCHNYKLNKKLNSVIFGSPRVGNYWFSYICNEFFVDKMISYQLYSDIINKVPLMSFGYHHIFNEIVIGQEKFWPLSLKDHYRYGEYF